METIIMRYIGNELVSNQKLLPLTNELSLLESGILDLLSLLKLVLFLEEEFQVHVDNLELIPENFDTIDAICAYIRSHQKG